MLQDPHDAAWGLPLGSGEGGPHPGWGHVPGSSPPLQDSDGDVLLCHTHRAASSEPTLQHTVNPCSFPKSWRLPSKGGLPRSARGITGSTRCRIPSIGTSWWHLHWHISSPRLPGFSGAEGTCPSPPHATLGSQDLAGAHHWRIWLQSSQVKTNGRVHLVPPPSFQLCRALKQLPEVPRQGSPIPAGPPGPIPWSAHSVGAARAHLGDNTAALSAAGAALAADAFPAGLPLLALG